MVRVEFPTYALSIHMSYKIAKIDKQHILLKSISFCMTPLHAHAQYICIVYAKYQKASVKALVQADFPVYALSKQKHRKKWLSSKRCHFVKKYFYGIKLLHANVQCVYIVYANYQMASVKALVQVDFPMYVLSEH